MHGNNRNNQPNAFELTAEQLAPFWATEKAASEDSTGFAKQEHSAQIEATELMSPSAESESADENNVENKNLLSKADLHHKINMNPDALTYLVPSHTKSAVWSKHDFRFIIYNDVKQKFVICMNCRSILSYTGESNFCRDIAFLLTHLNNAWDSRRRSSTLFWRCIMQ
jgi:hypothetical protein